MTRKKKPTNDIHIENILWDSADKVGYQTIIEVLAHDIQKSMQEENLKFDYICGIPRGGLTPAVGLSHQLGIPCIDFSNEEIYVKNVLFVEDIIHTGESISTLPLNHEVLTYRLATVVKNEICPMDQVWKFGIEVGKNVWVVFPWELEVTVKQAMKNLRRSNRGIIDDEQ